MNYYRAILLSALSSFLCLNLTANQRRVDGVWWYYNIENGEAEITSGEIKYEGDITIPRGIEYCRITSIGEAAFNRCYDLTSVKVSAFITTIGPEAFLFCHNLKSVELPTFLKIIGDYAFDGCKSLETISIPSGVVAIGDGAFSVCSSLRSIVIPSSVAGIGYHTFGACTNLQTVIIEDGVGYVGEEAFLCSSVREISIPNSITNIGIKAFDECTSLDRVNIDSFDKWSNISFEDQLANPLSYAHHLFENEVEITHAKFDGSVVKPYVLSGGSSIASIELPDQVQEIGAGSFAGCCSLREIKLPSGIKTIGAAAFSQCSNLTEIALPPHITSVPQNAFLGCTSLSSVSIPTGVCTIGFGAFKLCKTMSSIVLPPGVETIKGYAFDMCTNLVCMTIPSSLKSIEYHAFRGCRALQKVYVERGDADRIKEMMAFGGAYVDDISFIVEGDFSVEDGVLIAYNGTDESITIPKFVREISSQAFGQNPNIVCVTIPTNVLQVQDGTFSACSKLKEVHVSRKGLDLGTLPNGCEVVYDISYQVLFSLGEHCYRIGGGELTQTVKHGGSVEVPTLRIEDGYEFQGWSQDVSNICDNVEICPVCAIADPKTTHALYCQIDLSAGPSAEEYPVAYFSLPPCGVLSDDYKGTKLLVRRIAPGSFKMQNEHDVKITRPFYIGVFEVTQKQYELVMGANPSRSVGNARPVESVKYSDIRGNVLGAQWPNNSDVDEDSFLGRLRKKTNLNFDIPTEAQWEYACRAGTDTDYNSGQNNDGVFTDSSLDILGRYKGNMLDGKGGYDSHTSVGSYLPNAWGLFDMHGNVWEYCLDWWGETLCATTDPTGPIDGIYRVLRGSSFQNNAQDCTSNNRNVAAPNAGYEYSGFRIASSIREVEVVFDSCNGITNPTSRVMLEGEMIGELPQVERLGYGFDGWYDEAGTKMEQSSRVGPGIAKLFAHWVANNYSMHFVANGGDGEMRDISMKYDAITNLPTCAYSRSGYEFAGWSIGNPNISQGLVAGAIVSNLTSSASEVVLVYANWRECESVPQIGSGYCVIDLSQGANAKNYPVTYLSELPTGAIPDEYKLSKLLLRRVHAGNFKMQNQYQVTISKPFYIGVFEVTQKQYELVTGESPSQYKGDSHPVEKTSFMRIRGSERGLEWPASNEVENDSFIGCIRARTGLDVDLPTEAQWEYACRAGTSSNFNNGESDDSAMNNLGRFSGNILDGKGDASSAHAIVGMYLPNAWGLYDMHGNVWEWCLDKYGETFGGEDPIGSIDGTMRVGRGGSYLDDAHSCTSYIRPGNYPMGNQNTWGFRLVSRPRQVSVLFDSCNGGEQSIQRVLFEGDQIGEMPIVSRDGYDLVGWYTTAGEMVTTDFRVVSSNLTLSAKWQLGVWSPTNVVLSSEITSGSEITIPASWVKEQLVSRYGKNKEKEFRELFGSDFCKALTLETGKKDGSGNPLKVWHDYVTGTDPTDPEDNFSATVTISNGMVYVAWSPDLNTGLVTRIYKAWGRTSLSTGEWETPINSYHRFFKVIVSMATGLPGESSDVANEGFVPLEKSKEGVQLWDGGPYWAECNLGASKPEEYGYYFWWGDTVGYQRIENKWDAVNGTRSGFSFDKGSCPTATLDEDQLQAYGYVESSKNLVAEYDMATSCLGAPWRTPTASDFAGLIYKCTRVWTSRNGVCGWQVTGKGDYSSRSIFLPVAGSGCGTNLSDVGAYGGYWSSTSACYDYGDSSGAGIAYYLNLYLDGFNSSVSECYFGLSVRAVRESDK